MTDTPTGAEGTDTEPTDHDDLDSALEAAWSTEGDEVEDSLADEAVDEDTEDEPTEDDSDDEVADDDEGEDEEPEDDTESSADTQRFTVKIDGEEVEVTLEEALAGYQRQADYTRKTQALSQERERYAAFDALEAALRDNPQDTLSKLARLYGVDVAGAQDTQDGGDDPLEDLDPAIAQEIREMRLLKQEWQAEQERRAAAERSAQIDAEIEAVRTTFNDPDLDEAELLQFAVANGITSLEAAYKAMAFERAQAKAPKAKAREKVVERKRKAPPVEGGRNRSKGVVKGVDPLDMSIDDAFEMALSELG